MADQLGLTQIKDMFAAAAAKIRDSHQELSKLDSATGDGDHGTAMLKAMDAMEKSILESQETELQAVLFSLGWAVMGVDGGSTGPLFGSLFMGMSEGVEGLSELDASGLAAMFQAGLAKVGQQTKAQVGDKTLMDALIPAVEVLKKAVGKGNSLAQILTDAALAARKGAEYTKECQAKFGRARNLGARTIGHQDPGATSMALIFEGFAEAVA